MFIGHAQIRLLCDWLVLHGFFTNGGVHMKSAHTWQMSIFGIVNAFCILTSGRRQSFSPPTANSSKLPTKEARVASAHDYIIRDTRQLKEVGIL